MANPTLNWRFVGVRTPTTAGLISAIHDVTYALGTATTYADGTTRTPGTGSAWTWNREQSVGTTVAVYGVPPTNALSFSYIIGGSSAAAYTFLSPDNAVANNAMVFGMNRSSGAFTSWTSATPFTNAGFSGYWRGGLAAQIDSVAMWESQEACIVQYGSVANNVTSTIGFGALIDPLSTNASNAESDGRLYMMWGGGTNNRTNTTWVGQGYNAIDGNAWGMGNTTAQNAHAGVFAPGTNVMFGGAGAQSVRFGSFAPTSLFVSTNGDIARVPLTFTTAAGAFLGQSRQWYIVKDSYSRVVWQNGAVPIGSVWAPTLSSSTDAVLMSY